MGTALELEKTAVCVYECSEGFIMQRRPDLPGKLAYPGKLHFLGGHLEGFGDGEPEDPEAGIIREATEETNLPASRIKYNKLWEVRYAGTDKDDQPVERDVTVFLAYLLNSEITLQDQGELVVVAHDQVEAHAGEMAPFALQTLRSIVYNRRDFSVQEAAGAIG